MRSHLLATSLLIAAIIAMSGCANPGSHEPQADSINASYHITVNVVDGDGKNINYASPVFFNDSLFTRTNQLFSKSGGAGDTYVNGTSYGYGSTWPVNPGDYFVFGASTNQTLLIQDLEDRQFSPGKAGYWTILAYDDFKKYTMGDRNNTVNITITVSNQTGRMLKAS